MANKADDDQIVDIWSGLNHKSLADVAPAFLEDESEIRRINFYQTMRAYLESCARYYLTQQENEEDSEFAKRQFSWREFGDPSVICARIASAIVGEDFYLQIDGAGETIPESPELPDPPIPVDENALDFERPVREQAFNLASALWVQRATDAIDEWLEDVEEADGVNRRHEWLTKWGKKEQVTAKILENETENIVPLGSGVYAFGWDKVNLRPSVVLHQPDVYFPILETSELGQFPRLVYIAWVFEVEDENGEAVEYVRRHRYELAAVNGEDEDRDMGSQPIYLEDGKPWVWSCLYSDSTHLLDDFETLDSEVGAVYAIDKDGEGEVELRDLPLGYDFIPIIHMPNTLTSTAHYGRSSIARVVQLFDEIASTDADESIATRWAARPPVLLSGVNPGNDQIDLSPGKGIRALEGGSVSTIEMAQNLEQIGVRLSALQKRVSVNVSVPEGLLGRVDASEVPSGVTLRISYTSFEQMVLAGRLARAAKHALFVKIPQRIAIQNKDESLNGETRVYDGGIRFGPFMPEDLATLATVLATLEASGMVSRETGVKMLMSSGVPVTSVEAETMLIESRDALNADRLATAVGQKYAAKYLGIRGWEPAGEVDENGRVIPPGGAGVQDVDPDLERESRDEPANS